MYRAVEVAEYLIHSANLEEDGSLTNLKLQKLLYYVQGFHIALFGEPLFSDSIEAWNYGPAVPSVYREYEPFGTGLLPGDDRFNPESIDPQSQDLIDEVYGVYGKYTGTVLTNFTHQEKPWLETDRSCAIEPELLRDYFQTQLVGVGG